MKESIIIIFTNYFIATSFVFGHVIYVNKKPSTIMTYYVIVVFDSESNVLLIFDQAVILSYSNFLYFLSYKFIQVLDFIRKSVQRILAYTVITVSKSQ